MWTDLQAARLVQKKYEENRKELIANISHDLKTPITSILGYVEGLQENIAQTPEKRALYLATIHEWSKESLFEQIWEMDIYDTDVATVVVHIKRLREKLKNAQSSTQPIETIWGVGYRFNL